MWFWARQSCLLILLIVGAYFLIVQLPKFEINHQSNEYIENISNKTSTLFNRLDALTSSNPNHADDKRIIDYVIEVKMPDSSLTEQIRAIPDGRPPLKKNWLGEVQNHRFLERETIKTGLEGILKSEKLNLIWWLDRDYIAKMRFRLEDSTIGTLHQMATTVDSDFEKAVTAWVCHQKRLLVITDTIEPYLSKNCILASDILERYQW